MGAIAYDDAIEVVRSGDGETRARLGADPGTPPEFLYYLAEDPDVAVRRAVAENPNTPNKADLLLAKDADMGVRCILARKLVGDGLDDDERAKLWRMGFTILETLMRDQFVQVRRILTNAFHADPAAPHDVVLGLARDAEQEIAAPVLADSPVLTEDDLVSIIEDGAPGWAQDAIAGREALPPAAADAVIEAGDGRAGATLLARKDVALSQQCLTRAVEQAEKTPEWQSPLVVRPDVKGSLLVRLARFVAAPLLSMLRARPDIDAETAKQVDDAICSRPGQETKEARDAAAAAAKPPPEK